MKRFVLIFVCIVMLALIASCTKVLPPVSLQEGSKNLISDESRESAPQNFPTAPLVLIFRDLNEFQEFISMNNPSEKDISTFISKHPEGGLFTSEMIRDMIANVKDCYFPDEQFFDAEIEEFGATYYQDIRNELDLVYIVNGVRYRFTYSLDKPEYSYDKEPIAKCKFDNIAFYMYEEDKSFVGSVNADYATVGIVIYGQDLLYAKFFLNESSNE